MMPFQYLVAQQIEKYEVIWGHFIFFCLFVCWIVLFTCEEVAPCFNCIGIGCNSVHL